MKMVLLYCCLVVLSLNLSCTNVFENRELLEKALKYRDNGQIDSCEIMLDKILENDEHNVVANLMKGRIYLLASNYEQSLIYFNKAIETDPENSKAIFNIGMAYNSMNDLDDAVSAFDKYIELEPDNAWGYIHAGLISMKKYDFERSIEYNNRALNLKGLDRTSRIIAYSSIGSVYLRTLEFEKAEFYLKKAKEVNENNSSYWVFKADYHSSQYEYDKSLNAYRMAVSLDGFNPLYFAMYATCLSNLEKFDEAIDYYEKSLELEPNDYHTLFSMARCYAKMEEYEKSTLTFIKAEESDKYNDYSFFNKACIYSLQRKKDKMIENLEMAINEFGINKLKAKIDPDFDPYRDDPDFKKLVE
jgi:tetratricopeptide (TPR) repeat protein